MRLRRIDQQRVELKLTDAELVTIRNGLNEALEVLEDWEFATRMGVDRDEARRVRDELRDAIDCLEGSPSDS